MLGCHPHFTPRPNFFLAVTLVVRPFFLVMFHSIWAVWSLQIPLRRQGGPCQQASTPQSGTAGGARVWGQWCSMAEIFAGSWNRDKNGLEACWHDATHATTSYSTVSQTNWCNLRKLFDHLDSTCQLLVDESHLWWWYLRSMFQPTFANWCSTRRPGFPLRFMVLAACLWQVFMELLGVVHRDWMRLSQAGAGWCWVQRCFLIAEHGAIARSAHWRSVYVYVWLGSKALVFWPAEVQISMFF